MRKLKITLLLFVAMILTGCPEPMDEYYDSFATVWKNGEAQILTNGTTHASASSIYVVENDVYVTGNETVENDNYPRLWKNGVKQNIGTRRGYASSVYVSNKDVYVVGYVWTSTKRIATLWKNGEAQELTGTDTYSVYVTGSDVYVAGQDYYDINNPIAKLWKNGVEQNLSDVVGNLSSATSVYVVGNDVYVAGYINISGNKMDVQWVAAVWKNGEIQYLSDGKSNTYASSIFVFDGDVYVAGFESNNLSRRTVAIIWKNGEPQYLTDGSTNSSASSVYVSESNVYVVVNEDVRDENASGLPLRNGKLWKNGEIQNFANGIHEVSVSSVYVSEGDVYVAGNILERKCCR